MSRRRATKRRKSHSRPPTGRCRSRPPAELPGPSPWLSLAFNVAFGAIAGGVTNAVAVWMLFHPYERRFGFQGAIPKNKARLAKSVGRTVGERLLTQDDILGELNRSGLRESF